jgi:predicted permease
MRHLRSLLRRIVGTFATGRSERDLAEEIESHIEMHVEDNLRAGMTPEEARRAAVLKLGGVDATKELYRDRRGIPLVESLLQDARYGARTLAKSPGFTVVAVLALALGVGANTAIFSVANAVLLRPLPYPEADRLVTAGLSLPDYRDVRESTGVFEATALYASNLYNVGGEGETEQALGGTVSPEFMPMLGRPALGRTFGPDEDRERLVVLSYDFWRRRFGGDPGAIGQTLVLSGRTHTVVGVMPAEFQFPNGDFEMWVPFGSTMVDAPEQANDRSLRIFKMVARLAPGVTAAQAQADLDRLSERLEREYPATNEGVRIRIVSVYDRLVGGVRPALLVLLAAVGLLMLIGCANVANLLLARNTTREREIAIRAALGAGRWRVARQLFVESLILASLGGALGLALAFASLAVFRRLGLDDLPRGDQIGVDVPVLLFTLGAVLLAAALCGTLPALHAARHDLGDALKEGGRGAAGGGRGRRLRNALVLAEVALSVVVLVGAGLLVRSVAGLLDVDPGFRSNDLLTMNLQFVAFKDPQRRAALAAEALERIRRLPGVDVAGGATGLPPQTPQRATSFEVDGLPDLDAGDRSAFFIATSPDYFRALGTPLLAGRSFDDRDAAAAPKVVVVSEYLARRLFPAGDAVGRRVRLVGGEQDPDWRTIVGVAGDVRYTGLADAEQPAIYTPFAQTPFYWMYLMVRTSAPPTTAAAAIRGAVAGADPSLTIAGVRPMSQLVSESVAGPRFNMALLSIFAALGLSLAAVGVYGVVSYSVAQRSREFGVRAALGATPRSLVRLVLGQGLALGASGVAIGAAAAAAGTRLMTSMLYGVSATDPVTYAAVAAALLGVVAAACCVPALRAARSDPTVAMRSD